MTSSPRRSAVASAARWGLVVFVLGILMLFGVFFLSYGLFSGVAAKLAAGETAPVDSLPPIASFLAANFVKLLFLLVMGYISSLIAGKGLSLYSASHLISVPENNTDGSDTE